MSKFQTPNIPLTSFYRILNGNRILTLNKTSDSASEVDRLPEVGSNIAHDVTGDTCRHMLMFHRRMWVS